ncbi:MAG: twitching motility protein PilT [Chloroflexi bacterium RBG_13_68_17]|nr:MAG: twitching motility protein PilT [Chloroflexi bacterium RBG_13_68_17]
MPRLSLRFYQELNDFLSQPLRGRRFDHAVAGRASVKDVVEALGVPHTEVDLILVNGDSVDFGYQVRDGDDISVYPIFETLDVGPLVRLRPRPLREPRFIADVHLGRLAAYLRLFGFDCLFEPAWGDAQLAAAAAEEGRTLLTRDRGLLKRRIVTRGYCPRDSHPRRQLVEVLRRFELIGLARPFTRCMRCNGSLAPAADEDVRRQVPAAVAASNPEFSSCTGCGRVYWKGSHYDRMLALVEHVRRFLSNEEGS